MLDTLTYYIYGASDDLVEVETDDKSFSEEYELGKGGVTTLVVVAPESHGQEIRVRVEFGVDGWQIAVNGDNDWILPIIFGERLDREEDPAVWITAPVGSQVFELVS